MSEKRPRRNNRAVLSSYPEPELPEPASAARDHPHSRLIAHYVAEFILRCVEDVRQTFDHDYETAILFLMIATRNSEMAMNDPKLRQQYASYRSTIPPEHSLLVSRMALARASGLPRETVRRKVAKLIEKGWVIELPGGLRTRPDLNRHPDYIKALEPQAQNLRRLFTMLFTSGALNSELRPPA